MKSVKGKILAGFAVVLVILFGMAAYSYMTIRSVATEVQDITSNDMKFLEYSNSMTFSVAHRAKIARDYILFDREEFKEQFLIETQQAIEIEKNLNDAVESGRIPQEIATALKDADEKTVKWRKLVTDEIIPLYESGNQAGALKLMEEVCLPYSQAAIDAWVKVVEIQNAITNAQTGEVLASAAASKVVLVIISLLASILAVAVALYNARSISAGIKVVVERLENIAGGDLTGESLQAKSADEIGRLAVASNTMVANLKTLMSRVAEASNRMAASSEEFTSSAEQSSYVAEQVTQSIQDIAYGSELASKSVKDSVLAVGEMSTEVQRIAESSADVSHESQNTTNQALEGDGLIQKAVDQMQSIQTSVRITSELVTTLGERSKEIGQIVGVITGIAEQTNLLALNASIEAARAGEHGRGFAVVAGEVSKLAEQSKKAADQIATLIRQIQSDTTIAVESMNQGTGEVEAGTTVITEAGQAFEKILASIQLVSGKMIEVSSSARQMAGTAQQVNASVASLDEISQKTSVNAQNVAGASEEQLATMQEIAFSATSLNRLSEELQEELNKFIF